MADKNKRDASYMGAHAKKGQSAYIQKSTRMRKVLIVVIVLLIVLIAALGVFFFQLFNVAQNTAVQQTNISEPDTIESDDSANNKQTTSKKTTVPELTALIGLDQTTAIETLGHGAEITRTLDVNEEGNPIKQDVQVALTEEPADSRSGTPTVYLSLDETGAIIQVGYSAATSSLGYGTLSFSDAVLNENIVEKTLGEAGLDVEYGAAQLPEDKTTYSTYDTDGTTLIKEYCSFSGQGVAKAEQYNWESMLSYDYSMANATDNLNDTIRTIYIYISK